ncbi:anhydro-N-acetylmuramic acid kinase [Lampropedia cohaerens]|uniref:Anhydro-N-acetylmuramic acid kinase n=1 Tax=Lampropedia cohaerens TaxID=1610491 RepID=A0A0U1Q0X8_9BURK|nr:anhydro-N-acetylmuramic acid kinase [Lampropedia cohaerens]KKW68410.1 anhydro-N-acetylmuramic acid kinase [Lampropedia cohaerens]
MRNFVHYTAGQAQLETGWYVGLMSGTSLDGVDAVLARFASGGAAQQVATGAHVHLPFAPALVETFRRLNAPGPDELHQAALAEVALAQVYAEATQMLLARARLPASEVVAIGAHGQTVRHQPQGAQAQRYTIQLNNPAWLAEQTGIAVVADFRRRDMAAGGQGAPLASGFHRAVFSRAGEGVAILNLGGIANFSLMAADGAVLGFDCGPANTLMDGWCRRHTGQPYDADGRWAAQGRVLPQLLAALLRDPFFAQPAPKSTGLDRFNLDWLQQHLQAFPAAEPVDMQATLAELTAVSCAQAFSRYARGQRVIGVCGGGAYNHYLLERLRVHVGPQVSVVTTAEWGVPPEQVEACAFAWLARQCVLGLPGNLPAVTQARGPRVLGAIYPA